MKDLRVLLFSATYGAGHVRAAEALIEAFQIKEPSAKIIHLDFGAFLGKTFNAVVKSAYLEMIKYTPRLWGKFYYRTARIPAHSAFQRFLNRLGRSEFLKCINSLQPDLIICTYPTVAGVLAQLRTEQLLTVPLVTVVTDYAVHSQWIHQGVDLYIVGSQDIYQGLTSRGISPYRIKVTGIPVNPKFENQLDRRKISVKLGLYPNLPTILIMGGAYGVLEDAKRLFNIIADTETPVQAIVVCGRDEKLYKSLESVIAKARNPVHRYGFVHNVEDLMTVSDLIITKAGGLTVSEALTKHLPLLIYKPIPGQEEENSIYIQKIGAGRAIDTEKRLEQTVNFFLQHPGEIEKMRRAAALAVPKRSAELAVENILQLVKLFEMTQKTG